MPPRTRGYPAKQPCRTERKVPKHSLGPRVWGRGATRGSEGGYWGRLQRRTGAGRKVQDRGGRPALRLSSLDQVAGPKVPGTGARSSRAAPPAAKKPCASAPQGGRGLRLLGHSLGGLRLRAWPFPPWPAPLKAKAKLPGSTGAPRPGPWVPHSARPPHCARSASTRAAGSRHQDRGGSDTEGASVLLGRCECVLRTRQKSGREEGDWTPTSSGSVTATRACQSLWPRRAPAAQVGAGLC